MVCHSAAFLGLTALSAPPTSAGAPSPTTQIVAISLSLGERVQGGNTFRRPLRRDITTAPTHSKSTQILKSTAQLTARHYSRHGYLRFSNPHLETSSALPDYISRSCAIFCPHSADVLPAPRRGTREDKVWPSPTGLPPAFLTPNLDLIGPSQLSPTASGGTSTRLTLSPKLRPPTITHEARRTRKSACRRGI